jgi:hypothetical protein
MSLDSARRGCYPALVWELFKRAQIPLRVAAVIALAYLGYVLLARRTADQRYAERQKLGRPSAEQNDKFAATYGGSALKITQFFARDVAIVEGQSTVLCYGVLNAKSVRIDPPVGDVYPALNRCVDVAPQHDTKYTVTAVGNDGQTATAEFTLAVKADVESLPRVTSFRVTKHTIEQGKHYVTIAFEFANARTVTIDPPVFSTLENSAPFGQWVVTPDKTTTYTLTVMDKRGRKASKQLTVEVPKS